MKRKRTSIELESALVISLCMFILGLGLGGAFIFGAGLLSLGVPFTIIGCIGGWELVSCVIQHDIHGKNYYHRPDLPRRKTEREKLEKTRDRLVLELQDMDEEDVYFQAMKDRIREIEDAIHLIGTRKRDQKRAALLKQSGQLVAKTVNKERKELG